MVIFPARQLGQRHHHLNTRFEPAVKRLDGPDRGNHPLAPEPWQAKISERKLRVGWASCWKRARRQDFNVRQPRRASAGGIVFPSSVLHRQRFDVRKCNASQANLKLDRTRQDAAPSMLFLPPSCKPRRSRGRDAAATLAPGRRRESGRRRVGRLGELRACRSKGRRTRARWRG
jgi:hypothetical protein